LNPAVKTAVIAFRTRLGLFYARIVLADFALLTRYGIEPRKTILGTDGKSPFYTLPLVRSADTYATLESLVAVHACATITTRISWATTVAALFATTCEDTSASRFLGSRAIAGVGDVITSAERGGRFIPTAGGEDDNESEGTKQKKEANSHDYSLPIRNGNRITEPSVFYPAGPKSPRSVDKSASCLLPHCVEPAILGP